MGAPATGAIEPSSEAIDESLARGPPPPPGHDCPQFFLTKAEALRSRGGVQPE
jgi:hypothetical protein